MRAGCKVSPRSLLKISPSFGNAMCHAGAFRVNESNESTESNAVVKVIATEFYYRLNEGRRKSPLIYAYKEDHCPCAPFRF